jgi:hypothetical protein
LTHNKKVILFPQAKSTVWLFEDFVHPNGSNPIQEWLNQQSDEVQEMFNSVLKNMRDTEQHIDWVSWRRFLQGEARKHRIWEIGFQAEGRQYRVMGVFAGRKLVILLAGCYHKGKVYTPHDAIDSAIKSTRALKEGAGKTSARQVRIDF